MCTVQEIVCGQNVVNVANAANFTFNFAQNCFITMVFLFFSFFFLKLTIKLECDGFPVDLKNQHSANNCTLEEVLSYIYVFCI
jgi:hypothetical protein